MTHYKSVCITRIRTLFITTILILLPLIAFAEHHPLTTGFEQPEYTIGQLDGQNGWVTSATVEVQRDDVYRGMQAVALTSESQATYAFPSNESVVWIDAFCKAGANDVYPDLPMPAGYTCVLFFHATDGITCLDGNGSGIGTWRTTGIHANEWTRVAIRQDYAAHKWDLYVNGTIVLANLGNAYNTAQFTQFEARVSNGGSMLIDEFNEPLGEISVDVNNVTAVEIDTTITLPVTLSTASRHNVSVDVALSGTATGGGLDYTLDGGTLIFEPGVTSRDLALVLHDDLMDENLETITVTLSNPSTATLSSTLYSYTYTILDDDPAPVISFSTSTEAGPESQDQVNLLVSLSTASAKPISVNYAATGGTASDGEFTLAAGTLSFAPGVTTQTILLEVADDALDEEDKTVIVTLSGAIKASLGTVRSITYTIVDDDPAPATSFSAATAEVTESDSSTSVEVLLSGSSAMEVSVDCVLGTATTAVAGVDFTFTSQTIVFAPGETSKNVAVALLGNSTDEGNRDVEIVLKNAINTTLTAPLAHTITILDDDNPPTVEFAAATGQAFENVAKTALSVTLSEASAFPVSADILLSGGIATQGVDFTLATTGTTITLTFAPGETAKTILISVLDDEEEEADETVMLTISGAINASVGATASHTYTILNNDNTPIIAIFGAATDAGAELETSVAVPINLSAASSTATITVTYEVVVASTTAQAADYVLATNTIAFPAGETSLTIALTVVDDNVDETDEIVSLRIVSVDGGATVGTANTFNYTIEDDDDAPTINFVLAESAAIEAATTLMLNVSLSNPSAQTVRVAYATTSGTADGDDYIGVQDTLEFAPGETEGTINIILLGDTTLEADETFLIILSDPENTTLGTVVIHTHTILNNDRTHIPLIIIR